MALKKDPSWLNLATEVVQIPLALGPQHFLSLAYRAELSFTLNFKSPAFAPSKMKNKG